MDVGSDNVGIGKERQRTTFWSVCKSAIIWAICRHDDGGVAAIVTAMVLGGEGVLSAVLAGGLEIFETVFWLKRNIEEARLWRTTRAPHFRASVHFTRMRMAVAQEESTTDQDS